ncbi:hypothetical protein [Pararhodonellum marinum]|uniref:hypothetical protein n=1 Tax=Pararhodonellum marinum TaxID=2755358 RepID=UPI00188F2625|nr:hypothetical protein [Pararhodonellum marinum]
MYTVKNSVLNLMMGLAFLSMVLGGCNNDDSLPIVNPIIGEWVAAEGQFTTITVNGEEKTIVEFGMEVLKSNETEAELAGKEYLQFNFLGPIDMEEPKLLFTPSDKLIANLSGEQIEGTWELKNNKTILNLEAPDLYANGYSFNVKKLTANELELDWEWEMSLVGEDPEVFEVGLKIKLVK